MTEDAGFRYPLPSHAISAWYTGDGIALGLPGIDGSRGHTVIIPLEKLGIERGEAGAVPSRALGWATLMDLLKSRYRAANAQRPMHVASPAGPTAYQIEAALRRARAADPARTTLADLGLD